MILYKVPRTIYVEGGFYPVLEFVLVGERDLFKFISKMQ